jgi:hypothetical protein
MKRIDRMRPRDQIINFLHDYASKKGISHPGYEEEKAAAREYTRDRLLELFDDAQICRQSYPYPNRYDDDGKIPVYYFHATGRK